MKMQPVKSSNIVAIGYKNRTLQVEYKNGTYRFEDVSEETYNKLMAADSKGKFLAGLKLKGARV